MNLSYRYPVLCLLGLTLISAGEPMQQAWIRINQLGYTPRGVKAAVWCSKEKKPVTNFQLVDAKTKKIVFTAIAGKAFGAYGPFKESYRLNFSPFKQAGKYYLQAGDAISPVFDINDDVYKGTADFCLRYMRQQRSGFNPYLKDSCHTRDGYVLYGAKAGIPDSSYIDAVGGWHDASDYLQYSATSANATYHLLMAYRDFPQAFADTKTANGLEGKNGRADVLDEAKWGLDWLLKMHPEKDIMFNQIGDDRDHLSMRMPKLDSQYGRGYERPLYFINGEPQQRGKYMNNTTGTSSTAAKFASAFALGSQLFKPIDKAFSELLAQKTSSAYAYAFKKPGVTQTVSVLSPYIYAEDNWVDDMELAAASQKRLNEAVDFAKQEPVTPWLGEDTAKHYQWYPFINPGHYELAKQLKGPQKDAITRYYKEGIERVWNKAKANAFYRGVPFIWCSNNLTVAFAIQCYWYRQLTGEKRFADLEQANIDWLFGCNPWGTSMVYGLPRDGDTPVDPHSAFTHLKNYPIDGGLVDGPVYTSIFKALIGIRLYNIDEYEMFQSNLAVYHDDYGDYSTNEPTMDGTASLIYLLAANENEAIPGVILRGDTSRPRIALVFTADEFGDGGDFITAVLKKENVKASFFLTGNFYRNKSFNTLISHWIKDGHYVGSHSDKHLLYCDWQKRDSLLVTRHEFESDLLASYNEIERHGIKPEQAHYFLPPYEWYNDSIVRWTNQLGLQLVCFTPGTRSTADYTYPEMGSSYADSKTIVASILNYEQRRGMNGFILLVHAGTDPRRKDKLYHHLPLLIKELKARGYRWVKINELIEN